MTLRLITSSTLCKAVLVLIAVLYCDCFANGQDAIQLKRRCEKVIVDSLNESEPGSLTARAYSCARLVPIEAVKPALLKGLASEDIQVRFIASKILIENAPMEFKDQVARSLKAIEPKESTSRVQRAALLMKLGDEKAKQEVGHWVGHEFDKLDTGDWVCPMMCVKPEKSAGRCSVCRMELQKSVRIPDDGDWEAKFYAIRALRDSGKKVAEQARSIVTSDAPAFVRVQAAALWANENPKDAMPHLRVYLDSPSRYLAVGLLADLAPKESVNEFQKVIAEAKDHSDPIVLAAHRGLLRAGKTTHLKTIRKRVEEEAKSLDEEIERINGIFLLGELGLNEDIPRLEKLMDTKFKVVAAETLLRVFARKNSTNQ